MSLTDRSIYLEQDYFFQLIGTNIKKFLLFSIKKTYYQTLYGKSRQNAYETFLLLKAHPESSPEKLLVFSKDKIQESQLQKNSQNNNFISAQTYFCSFLRYLNLAYYKKVSQVLEMLNINVDSSSLNQWFILYQVHNYKISIQSLKRYKLSPPIYGSKATIIHHNSPKKKKQRVTISNIFRAASQNFYFINDFLDSEDVNDMSLIVTSEEKDLYGLTYRVKDQILCIPLNLLIYEKSCETIIDDCIMNKLKKTCYVGFMGSYCTGIEFEQDKIITTKHLLPKHLQKLDTEILIKKYPYKQNTFGIVTKIGKENLDFMQIQIVNQRVQKGQIKKRQEKLVKQILTANVENNKLMQKNQQDLNCSKNKETKDLFKQIINLQEKCSIGDSIVALGFGRIFYGINIFEKFELILPTVAMGVVSKKIQIFNENLFLKTDAKLYSGFSGCGIWKQFLVGMAVFILKNKNTHFHHNRHNFSYTSELISKLMCQQQNQLKLSFNQQIERFDKIQTRDCMQLIELPRPKL